MYPPQIVIAASRAAGDTATPTDSLSRPAHTITHTRIVISSEKENVDVVTAGSELTRACSIVSRIACTDNVSPYVVLYGNGC